MKPWDMASGGLSRVTWAVVIGIFVARCGGSPHDFPPPSIFYNVCFTAGGVDRLFIAKANKRRGLCTRMTLVRPATSSALADISLPYGWGVESASVSNNSADCQPGVPGSGQLIASTRGKGAVILDARGGIVPRLVTVDARVYFPSLPDGGPTPLPAWVPLYSTLGINRWPVTGCGP
jgi:hypothetical protein